VHVYIPDQPSILNSGEIRVKCDGCDNQFLVTFERRLTATRVYKLVEFQPRYTREE
jgi:hypothetical protein